MKKILLGEASFTKMIEWNGLYVDKTKQIYDIIQYSPYLFLSRPRRFGKSLLVSTLEALFVGKKDLFKGLWIADKWEWEEYPVIRLDFSKLDDGGKLEDLEGSLVSILEEYADDYQLTLRGKKVPALFNSLISKLYKKTGKRVVILIDEYDNPITSYLSDIPKAERNQKYLRKLYQIIKAQSETIHFLFITGISKFAKVSIFSAISQLKDISLESQFSDIMGFTEAEIRTNFAAYLLAFSRAKNMEIDELMYHITRWYDGYSWNGTQHLYNPFAIVNAMMDQRLENYWFETGTPGFLIDLIINHPPFKNEDAPYLQQLDNLVANKKMFDSYDLENINLTAALFQSGYLTVKKVENDGFITNYILGFPNYEVRHAFNAHLLKVFTRRDVASDIEARIIQLRKALQTNNKEQFQQLIASIFAGIPSNNLKKIDEFGYQAMFYQILLLLGINDIFLEVSGYIGRADGVLLFENKVFVFEFKFARQGTMTYLLDKAADQTKTQGYWHPYLGTEKEIYRIAVGFLFKKKEKDGKPELTIDSDWKRIVE